uniref:Uncharacterized protein n=1 Tax=Arundo donax TaxID=35708 RepID=A0A0A8ZLW4_ARUDO
MLEFSEQLIYCESWNHVVGLGVEQESDHRIGC